MSKLYSKYNELKEKDSSLIYLFKSGIFYIALADDAIYLSNKFNLKLTSLNKTVVKCGFPISSIDKYTQLFYTYNIKFKFIDFLPNNTVEKNFNNYIKELITSIQKIDIDSLSVSEAYQFIEQIKEKAKNINV